MATKKDGKIWIEGMESAFAGQTLGSIEFREAIGDAPTTPLLPDVWVLKMGGQSVIDRGRKAVFPIIEELLQARDEGTKFILGTGGGTRARHAYALALDLNMPTGMLASLGASIPLQNARMLQMLLMKHNGILVDIDDFEKLALYFQLGCIPITPGMPPFDFWEKSPEVGRIPPHRTDAGIYLIAEFLGARGTIFIKDEDGLYTDDPKKDPDAKFIPEITAKELLESGQDDLVVERVVLEYMERAKHAREIRIVNGLKPGNVIAALRGEPVGSVIRASS
jgi:molybdenum storage protein